MKTYDRRIGLFWLAFAAYVCIGSLRMGLGTLRNPGMGFMTFGSSALLGLLSLILFFRTFSSKKKEEIKPGSVFAGRLWKRVLWVFIALLIYSEVMPSVGYLISTFLLMSFLYWIVRGQKWWWVLVSSLVTTVVTYYVFSILLNCQFPPVFLGF